MPSTISEAKGVTGQPRSAHASQPGPDGARQWPTIWGLSAVELHDRFWASRGVQVIRQGEESQIIEDAELFLCTAPRTLAIFRLKLIVEELSWLKPKVIWVRLHDQREQGYKEKAISDAKGNLLEFQRSYGGVDSRTARVAITPNPDIARAWQLAADLRSGWRAIRSTVPNRQRSALVVKGRTYDRNVGHEVSQFVHDLVGIWKRPDTTIDRVRHVEGRAWTDRQSTVDAGVGFVGPVWVGAGRHVKATTLVGPTVLWDDKNEVPQSGRVQWSELEPQDVLARPLRRPMSSSWNRSVKRLFDIVFALLVLVIVLPLFPLVMLAIWIEDGRPFFFAHRRETLGGRQFPCFKFRSMRKDAEQIKRALDLENQADGPQFYIDKDPRITRVGRVLRLTQIDELPQLFNVLLGHMSMVGPRPSPHKENQYCPPWREARLSVRAGMTGLWQVMRTRNVGEDFQEWIRFDVEYVERASLSLDLWIIWRTFIVVVAKIIRGQ